MIRILLSTAAAAVLLAAPIAATAAPAHPVRHHAVRHAVAKPHGRMVRAAPRPDGAAATDALNEQSLQRARGGQ